MGGLGVLLILAVCRWGSQLSIDIGSCLVMIFFMTIKVLFVSRSIPRIPHVAVVSRSDELELMEV